MLQQQQQIPSSRFALPYLPLPFIPAVPFIDDSDIFINSSIVGPPGPAGPQGEPGVQGEAGPQGPQGEPGFSPDISTIVQETGTWKVSLNEGRISTTNEYGEFYRIGGLVLCNFKFTVTEINKSKEDVLLGELPFPAKNSTLHTGSLVVTRYTGLSPGDSLPTGKVVAGSNFVELFREEANGANTVSFNTSDFKEGTEFEGTIIYLI